MQQAPQQQQLQQQQQYVQVGTNAAMGRRNASSSGDSSDSDDNARQMAAQHAHQHAQHQHAQHQHAQHQAALAAAAAAGAGAKKADGMDEHGNVVKKTQRRRGRPTKAMVAQRERQQAQAAADRVLGALDVIEGNMGGVRAFVDCVTASVITGSSKKGVRIEQGDVDLAKQAVRSIQTAMVRLRAAVASGALSHVAAIAGAAGTSMLMSAVDGKGPVGDEEAEEAEKARKLSELTRNMLPNDWRCGACKYVNSFSDGPCGWCGKNKTVATGTGMWDPFKGKRKRHHQQQHAQQHAHHHMQHQMMDMPVGAGAAVNAAMAAVAQSSKGGPKVPRRMGPGQSMQQAVTTVGAPRAVVNVTTTPAVVQPASAAGAMGQKQKKKNGAPGQLDVATA